MRIGTPLILAAVAAVASPTKVASTVKAPCLTKNDKKEIADIFSRIEGEDSWMHYRSTIVPCSETSLPGDHTFCTNLNPLAREILTNEPFRVRYISIDYEKNGGKRQMIVAYNDRGSYDPKPEDSINREKILNGKLAHVAEIILAGQKLTAAEMSKAVVYDRGFEKPEVVTDRQKFRNIKFVRTNDLDLHQRMQGLKHTGRFYAPENDQHTQK